MNKEQLKQKRKYWRVIIDEFEQSGLSQTQFAKEKGLNNHQISYWLKKFKKSQAFVLFYFTFFFISRP